MKILVLGASGGVGRHLVRTASDKGHEVTALMRSEQEVPTGVRLVVDDVQREGCLTEVVRGQDAVLSALGLRRNKASNPFGALASPPDLVSRTARTLVAAMREHGVGRVIAVSASGVGDSVGGLNLMMRAMIRITNVGIMYRDLNAMEQVYAASGLDWCCVRPTGLKDGPQTGLVKRIDGFPLTARISRADVAAWMVEHVSDTSSDRTPIITG
jgi:putative NADH-flavin reductase